MNDLFNSPYTTMIEKDLQKMLRKKPKYKDRYIKNYQQSIYEHLNIQRNAHCPCGSGKKYKKCCIDKKEV